MTTKKYSDGPFVYPNLTATKNGQCDPHIIVETWLNTIEEIVNGVYGKGEAHQAFDLLATFCKLRRVRPEILAELGADKEMEAAKTLIEKGGKDLVELALTVPNMAAWMKQAENLKKSFEDMSVKPEANAGFVSILIDDFDDANCIAEMTSRWEVDDREFLNQCMELECWLRENADSFTAAGVYIQAYAMTFRPSLRRPDTDLEDMLLHRTTIVFTHLLNELVRCEAGYSGLPQFNKKAASNEV